MVLLNDEEIMDVVLDEGLGVVADENTRAIAKAQLKQVVEWGDKTCYDHNGEQREEQGWFVKRHDCPKCWQDLKKEASLDMKGDIH